jgi:hypothetical protein
MLYNALNRRYIYYLLKGVAEAHEHCTIKMSLPQLFRTVVR